jgi:uncharacterized membrane protein
MSPNRLEAFSDGVFAIAITLLVLDLHVPAPGSGSLGNQLLSQWPSYAAYVISFLTIGIIWINHHALSNRLAKVDHPILMLNLALLLCVGFLPFTTSLMSTYLKADHGENLAAAIYAASFLTMGFVFGRFTRHVYLHNSDALKDPIAPEDARKTLHYASLGQIPYLAATGLAFVSPYITIIIVAVVAVYYALPIASDQVGVKLS